jgi:hypothetical protein
MAKALTHLTEVVALGHFVEVGRFADLQARQAGSCAAAPVSPQSGAVVRYRQAPVGFVCFVADLDFAGAVAWECVLERI